MYLERAVNNYLMNAFQHTEQGCRIRTTLKKEKADMYGSLQMMESRLKKSRWIYLGELFTQLPVKKKTNKHLRMNGRHIGLDFFVVRKIVDKHKGSCGAQNMENGVLFWFQLPEIRDLGK